MKGTTNIINSDDENIKTPFDKIDKWIGIKLDDNYSSLDLANARFKASYQMLYTLLGLSFILSAGLMYLTKGSNDIAISLMLGSVLYGLFTFIFHLNKDALMLGFLTLTIIGDKLFTIFITHRIGGMSIVILGVLLMIVITTFKANKGMDIDVNENRSLKLISRIIFVLVVMLGIYGLYIV